MATGGMGGAAFTVRADTAQFTQGLKEAEGTAKQTSQAIGRELHAASSQGSRGILQAAYALDDLQYGFRSIVNNIPQALMFLGPGIAGAAGVAAVAISQLINHWEGLTELFSGEEKKLPKLKSDLEGLAEALSHISAEIKGLQAAQEARAEGKGGWLQPLTDAMFGSEIKDPERLRQLQELQREGKEREKAEKAMEASGPEHTKMAGEIAKRVKEAVAEMPFGSDTLLDMLVKQGMDPMKAKKAIAGALAGSGADLDEVLRNVPANKQTEKLAMATPEMIARDKDLDLEEKQAQVEATLREKAEKKRLEQEKKAAEEVKRVRVQALEDQRSALVEEHHQMDLKLGQLKEQLGHSSQTLSGPKAVSDYYMKAAADSPLVALAKATKDIQEQQREELKKINAKLEKERRVRPA